MMGGAHSIPVLSNEILGQVTSTDCGSFRATLQKCALGCYETFRVARNIDCAVKEWSGFVFPSQTKSCPVMKVTVKPDDGFGMAYKAHYQIIELDDVGKEIQKTYESQKEIMNNAACKKAFYLKHLISSDERRALTNVEAELRERATDASAALPVCLSENIVSLGKYRFHCFQALTDPLKASEARECLQEFVQLVSKSRMVLHNNYFMAHIDVRLENICFVRSHTEKQNTAIFIDLDRCCNAGYGVSDDWFNSKNPSALYKQGLTNAQIDWRQLGCTVYWILKSTSAGNKVESIHDLKVTDRKELEGDLESCGLVCSKSMAFVMKLIDEGYKYMYIRMDYHIKQLPLHCRVCGHRVIKRKSKKEIYECKAFAADLQLAFSINTLTDNPQVHPEHFCKSCHLSMTRGISARAEGVHHRCALTPFVWEVHANEGCKIAPPPIFSHEPYPPLASQNSSTVMNELKCVVCSNIVTQPLELPCRKLACTRCVVERVAASSPVCPCCSEDSTLDVLVQCAECHRDVKAGCYEEHECTPSLTFVEEREAAALLKRAVFTFPYDPSDG
ncbi:hypothetical protein EMCRGX_G024910 [Ephydatia muelleri]